MCAKERDEYMCDVLGNFSYVLLFFFLQQKMEIFSIRMKVDNFDEKI